MVDDKQSTASIDIGSEDADNAPQAPPCAMVIFGAAGDLTKRLVVPALYNLSRSKRLADGFRIVGVDLADEGAEAWRRSLTDMMAEFARRRRFRGGSAWIRTRGAF